MSFKKIISERLFNLSKVSTQTLTKCRISSSPAQTRIPPSSNRSNIAPDPGDNGIFRRFLHRRSIFPPEIRSLPPIGENLKEKLKVIGIAQDRIRLDGLTPPPMEGTPAVKSGLTVEEARKFLRVAQLETVKSKLRMIQRSFISYSEFIRICEETCSDTDQSRDFAKTLDESGNVIVLGNVVFLRPEEEMKLSCFARSKRVAKVIQELIPVPEVHPNDPRRQELEDMENKKAEIDKKADFLVRRELWMGLAYLVVQTAGFMRLTFWELSWDVMEPICFYVTSIYFMAGYAFFLRTSKEPSFEGFFQSRFSSKQKRLMKRRNFDLERYNELRKAFNPTALSSNTAPLNSLFNDPQKTQFGVIPH